MILTPEEQTEAREEIDYLIETNGYEYVWGQETTMDKTKALLRDAPARISEGLQKLASNPALIKLNEKAMQMNENLCRQEAERERAGSSNGINYCRPTKKPRQEQRGSNLGGGFIDLDFGNDRL